jgi:hypothetical protein
MLPLTRLSVQKHLGAPTYELIKYVLSQETLRFADILNLVKANEPYKAYKRNQTAFLSNKFGKKEDSKLSLLRYEEIIDPKQARSLFAPYMELFNDLSTFGNAILYGHRGSGKSSYLAAMAYFPEAEGGLLQPFTSFGVFFACRQGEFKQFTSELLAPTREVQLTIKHILLLKIIRKTVGTLRNAATENQIGPAGRVRQLSQFLSAYIPAGATLSVTGGVATELQNLHASLLRNEIEEIDHLFADSTREHTHRLLTEGDLINFFLNLRECFAELIDARFFLLLDDAGHPNVPTTTQKVINELIRCTNAIFCVKVSAERFSYTLESADGKPLELSHDYTEFDISDRLRLGTPSSEKRRQIAAHFHLLVQKRLVNYRSADIADYLGAEPVKTAQLVQSLASGGGKQTHYAGWNVVWQLADRTPRHLLELVSEIFSVAQISRNTPPTLISTKLQDQAIVSYSTKKLRALSFITGALREEDTSRSVGDLLWRCTTAFGKLSKAYLRRGPMNTKQARKRYQEVLAVEIDDPLNLSPRATTLLQQLVRFAVFDDTKLTASRADKLKKPIYILNRIFCPALKLSYRREMHWRLSSIRFENFLLHPEAAVDETVRVNSRTTEPELPFQ